MGRGSCSGRDGHARRVFGSRAWLRGAVPRGGAERRPIVGLIYRPKEFTPCGATAGAVDAKGGDGDDGGIPATAAAATTISLTQPHPAPPPPPLTP